jgi:hypothetical protein
MGKRRRSARRQPILDRGAPSIPKIIQVLTKPDFVFGVLDFIERLLLEDYVRLREFSRAR